MFSYPFVCFIALHRNRDKLKTKEMEDKIGKMYTGVSLTRSDWGIYYYPIFMLKRMMFVFVPMVFPGQAYFQIQIVIFVPSLYIIFYGGQRPHVNPRVQRVEMFNEFVFMGLLYHLLTFTLFNLDAQSKFTMGYSFLAMLGLLIVVNLMVIARNSYDKYRRKRLLKELRKIYKKKVEHLQKIDKIQSSMRYSRLNRKTV